MGNEKLRVEGGKWVGEQLAVVKPLVLPVVGRVICVSDIHGELDLFVRLLEKVGFGEDDVLVLVGDLYTKGTQCRETLRYMMELSERPNVHMLRGNADWLQDDLTAEEVAWLEALPHIIETDEYIFVHGGLTTDNLQEQTARACMKNDNFLEKSPPRSGKWQVVGHWPVGMYHHGFPDANPIVSHEKRVIAIDGGNIIKSEGQLNAFIIENGEFSHTHVDKLPLFTVPRTQPESGGTLHITWLDRFVEKIEDKTLPEGLTRVRHLATGRELTVPTSRFYTDPDGRLGVCNCATDYHLPVTEGEVVGLVQSFPDRVFAKKNGIGGWIKL
jgi:protein phosphatase